MKKLALLFAFIFSLSFITMAQIEEEGGQFFGGQRAVAFNQHDFGVVTDVSSYEFIIKNNTPNDLYISKIDIPDGVTVTVINKKIKPHSEGKIIVTIDKKNLKVTGAFKLPMIVTTEQTLSNGQKIIKESLYMLIGKVE